MNTSATSGKARVVVTGGAGFIGSHLTDALLARGDTNVIVLDNLYRGRWANVARHDGDPRFTFVHGDVRNQAHVDALLHGVDVVYHLAAQSNVMGAVSDPRYSFDTNVAGTFNVLSAARDNGVRRVVFASSREAYGEPATLPVHEEAPLQAKNTYGASKVAAEVYCRTFANVFGLETAVLRFSNVYGPRDHGRVIPLWIERSLKGEPLEVYGGGQVIDFVWVGVAVEALLRAADAPHGGFPVNVAGGVATPIRELAARILTLTGSPSPLHVVPARSAEVARFVADVARMSAVLGIVPPTDPLGNLSDLLVSATVSRSAS